MFFIKDIFRRKKEREKGRVALEKFLHQFYYGDFIDEKIARSNLSKGVVEFRNGAGHKSNALLISEDGYALTAYHCVKDLSGKKAFVNDIGYKIERILAHSSNPDIALIKIGLNGESNTCQYKLFDTQKLITKFVVQLTKWDNKLMVKRGEISFNHHLTMIRSSLEDTFSGSEGYFLSNIPSIPGDSGGVITDYSGNLIGLTIGAGFINNEPVESYGLKLNSALEILSKDLYR